MIACIIEFGVKPGMEEAHQAALLPLLEAVKGIDGFLSKETFDSRNTPGRIITVSYWRDEAALAAWMRDADHRSAIELGQARIFSHYTIQIATIEREHRWAAP